MTGPISLVEMADDFGVQVGFPPFGKGLTARLTLCSLCIIYSCNFSFFPVLVSFGGRVWVLITTVPGHFHKLEFAALFFLILFYNKDGGQSLEPPNCSST